MRRILSHLVSSYLVLKDHSASWKELYDRVAQLPTGQRLANQVQLREHGYGRPDANARWRLFDDETSKDNVRIIFYRDQAAWCPYCQKVWLLLEELQIPYQVEKFPFRHTVTSLSTTRDWSTGESCRPFYWTVNCTRKAWI